MKNSFKNNNSVNNHSFSNKEREDKCASQIRHEEYYYSESRVQRRFERMRVRAVRKLMGEVKGKKILDVGVGDGLMDKLLGLGSIWAVDISPRRCDRAKYMLPNAKISVQNAEKLNFKDGFFDGVICTDVLEHIDNPDKAIREMVRVTKKNGFVVVLVPNEPALSLARCVLLRNPANPDHIHSLSKRFLVKNFKRKPSKTYSVPNLPYPFCIIQGYRFVK